MDSINKILEVPQNFLYCLTLIAIAWQEESRNHQSSHYREHTVSAPLQKKTNPKPINKTKC